MSFEHQGRESESPADFYSRVEKYRVELEAPERTAGDSESAVDRAARINLESFGRGLLDIGKNLSGAVEFLDLAGALDKPEVQTKLRDHLDRLRQSTTEADQTALLEVSKGLAAARSRRVSD
jgi:hypothetical protein